MRAISQALYAELLSHHQATCRQQPVPPVVDACLITYGQLVERSRVPISPRSIGPYLADIAKHCADRGWPPLNALVVNQDTRMPGDSYSDAVGCSLTGWVTEAERCITFRGYEGLGR